MVTAARVGPGRQQFGQLKVFLAFSFCLTTHFEIINRPDLWQLRDLSWALRTFWPWVSSFIFNRLHSLIFFYFFNRLVFRTRHSSVGDPHIANPARWAWRGEYLYIALASFVSVHLNLYLRYSAVTMTPRAQSLSNLFELSLRLWVVLIRIVFIRVKLGCYSNHPIFNILLNVFTQANKCTTGHVGLFPIDSILY